MSFIEVVSEPSVPKIYFQDNSWRDCVNGHKGEPYEHQPVEDANFCANCAWKSVEEKL